MFKDNYIKILCHLHNLRQRELKTKLKFAQPKPILQPLCLPLGRPHAGQGHYAKSLTLLGLDADVSVPPPRSHLSGFHSQLPLHDIVFQAEVTCRITDRRSLCRVPAPQLQRKLEKFGFYFQKSNLLGERVPKQRKIVQNIQMSKTNHSPDQ